MPFSLVELMARVDKRFDCNNEDVRPAELLSRICGLASPGSDWRNRVVGLDCHSRTVSRNAETSSILLSLLNHRASSLIWLISYLPLEVGVTLMADVYVSKVALVCDVGDGGLSNAPDSVRIH